MLDFHFLELKASVWKLWLSSLVCKTTEIEVTKRIERRNVDGAIKNYVQVECPSYENFHGVFAEKVLS